MQDSQRNTRHINVQGSKEYFLDRSDVMVGFASDQQIVYSPREQMPGLFPSQQLQAEQMNRGYSDEAEPDRHIAATKNNQASNVEYQPVGFQDVPANQPNDAQRHHQQQNLEQDQDVKNYELAETAPKTINIPFTFQRIFLSSKNAIDQLINDIFAQTVKYATLSQNSQVLDRVDRQAINDDLRRVTSRLDILSELSGLLDKYLRSRQGKHQLNQQIVRDLNYLINTIEPSKVEDVSHEGLESMLQNVKKLQNIFTAVSHKIFEEFGGRSDSLSKYLDILTCLTKELREIVETHDVARKLSTYDPYRVKQSATNTELSKTQTVQNTARKCLSKDHYPTEYILFNRNFGPEVFDYVQPPLHRVYLSEAAIAYPEVAAVKISKIVLEEELEDKPQIQIANYFNQDCQNPILHYCKPKTKEIIFYNLVDIFDVLSITREYQHVREVNMNFVFSEYTRSIVTPGGKIFITNAKMKQNGEDLTFFECTTDGNLKQRTNLLVSKKEHAMVHLNNFIYIVGGATSTKKCTNSCHRYDIKRRTWSEVASCNYAFRRGVLAAFNSRYIFRFGGLNQFDYIDKNIEAYDSMQDGWTIVRTSSKFVTQQTEVLFNGFALPINENTIYVFGGDNGNGYQTDTGYTMTVVDIKERKKKPSRMEGLLRSLRQTKRTVFSYAGRFLPGSEVIYKGSIYFLREKYF